MSNTHVVRVITALVNATRFLNARGLQCTDAVVRRFAAQFASLESLLGDIAFTQACYVFARYVTDDGDVPSTMADLAVRVRTLTFKTEVNRARHAAINYDVCFLAFCNDDTAQLAKTVTELADDLLNKCDVIARVRQLENVNGHIVFVHANERNYDCVPPVAKADAMRNKHVLTSVSIEFFYAAELQFDRLAHRDVPEHVPLDLLTTAAAGGSEQARAQLARDSAHGWRRAQREPHNMPKLQTDDIIVRLLGMVRGQLVRVESCDIALGGTTFEYLQII